MQFAVVTVYPFCCTYRCINYSARNYWLILVFSTINLNWIATDHTIRDLFMYTSSIRYKKQIEDKDICLRSVCAKIFKFKPKLAFAVCTHKLRIPEVGVVPVQFQLQ